MSPSVSVILYSKIVRTISHKPLVGISPNLQPIGAVGRKDELMLCNFRKQLRVDYTPSTCMPLIAFTQLYTNDLHFDLSELENLFSTNSHSHDEYLWQVSLKSIHGRTDGRTTGKRNASVPLLPIADDGSIKFERVWGDRHV